DVPKALESAERAIALKDPPTEAWFNRALALERLHLTDAAKKAWQDYLDRDATSGWADEARQHLETLRSIHQTSAEEASSRARAPAVWAQDAIDRQASYPPRPSGPTSRTTPSTPGPTPSSSVIRTRREIEKTPG